jgi:hypothetical protein
MTFSVLDKRPAKAATALHSSPPPGPMPGAPATQASSERPFWILGAVVAVVTFAVFLPSVRNGWVNWDDADNFLGNPYFRGLGWDNLRWIFAGSVQDAHWIPLTWLTLSLDYVVWGMNPSGYHLTSLLIHSVNALLCYALAYRLLKLGFGAHARPRDLRLAGPEHPAAWIRLGVILWTHGQREEATRAWAQAVSLAPRWGDYQLWEIRLAVSEVPEAAAVARGRLAFNLGTLLEQYRQPGQALEQYRVAVALLPDDVTAGGRARRLAMAMVPREPVTCAPGKRP